MNYKKQETILAAYIKRLKLKSNSDSFFNLFPINVKFDKGRKNLNLDSILFPKIHFKKPHSPIEIMKIMPAIQIKEKNILNKTKINFNLQTKLEIVNFSKIFRQQSELFKDIIKDNKKEIQKIAIEKYKKTK